MPNRIIKESLLTSAQYASLGLFERDLFIRLIVAADDYGRYDARPAVVQGRLMPLEEGVTRQQVIQGLQALEKTGLIALYTHEGFPYLYLTGWERHQTIRAKRSKYPAPGENAPAPPGRDERAAPAGASPKPAEWAVPTLGEVTAYCLREGLAAEKSQSLIDFLTRQPVKNWQAVGRVWLRSRPGEKTGNERKEG